MITEVNFVITKHLQLLWAQNNRAKSGTVGVSSLMGERGCEAM